MKKSFFAVGSLSGIPQVKRNDGGETSGNHHRLQNGAHLDFNGVYQLLFKPALDAAGLQPFRADDEEAAGDILKDMFAELVTADFVLADISILNANAFYELGIRHIVGPRGVICVHADGADWPFDVAPGRTFKYDGKLFQVGVARDDAWKALFKAEAGRLGETLRKAVAADRTNEASPVYGNLPNLVPPDASRIGTARFKHYRALAEEWNQRVIIAGKEGRAQDILTLAATRCSRSADSRSRSRSSKNYPAISTGVARWRNFAAICLSCSGRRVACNLRPTPPPLQP
jgi:hypothetical protein